MVFPVLASISTTHRLQPCYCYTPFPFHAHYIVMPLHTHSITRLFLYSPFCVPDRPTSETHKINFPKSLPSLRPLNRSFLSFQLDTELYC